MLQHKLCKLSVPVKNRVAACLQIAHMDIKNTLEKYKTIASYFDPEYNRENDALTEFKANNPILSKHQSIELINLLQNNSVYTEKYFVADLLYLYDNFSKEILESLINTAINHKDPSLNRIFLIPCLKAYGIKVVTHILADRFAKADIIECIGISKLAYWLRRQGDEEFGKLYQRVQEKTDSTSNLVELYHYKLYCTCIVKAKVPDNAIDLIKAISGNKEYEELLFDKLGWARTASSKRTLSRTIWPWLKSNG